MQQNVGAPRPVLFETAPARHRPGKQIVPDLGDDRRIAALDRAIDEFIHRITCIPGKCG